MANHGMLRTMCGPSVVATGSGQALPGADRQIELRVLRIQIGQRLALGGPVFPDELARLGAPLLLEVEGAFAGRRAAEVERAEAAARSRTRTICQ